ncbi:MAG TPA: hypothetical protein VGL25_09125 [Casimicrobiaceae bacterium]|jgi:hypothetical protein
MSNRQLNWDPVIKRNRRWRARWGSFLMGVCIGLLIVTPVLAAPQTNFAALLPNEPTVLPPLNANLLLDCVAFIVSVAVAQIVFAANAARSRLPSTRR